MNLLKDGGLRRVSRIGNPTFNFSNSILFLFPIPNVTVIGSFRKLELVFQHLEESPLLFDC
jgi:hypothetical protein